MKCLGFFQFKAYAVADGSGDAEEPMDVIVNVIDLNDNNPVFVKDVFLGEVPEASPKSTGGLNSVQVVLNEIEETCSTWQ